MAANQPIPSIQYLLRASRHAGSPPRRLQRKSFKQCWKLLAGRLRPTIRNHGDSFMRRATPSTGRSCWAWSVPSFCHLGARNVAIGMGTHMRLLASGRSGKTERPGWNCSPAYLTTKLKRLPPTRDCCPSRAFLCLTLHPWSFMINA